MNSRMDLARKIEHAYDSDARGSDARDLFEQLMEALNEGRVRAAEPVDGQWRVNTWVKKGILLGFRLGKVHDYTIDSQWPFFDKDTYPLKKIAGVDRNIRIVPGGSAVRSGCFIAANVTMMPPMYINVGAYVDEGTMIDSHALVGSCAQVGKRVHVSAGSQIGGVIEPVGALPVVIEDDVLIGGNCGVYEGTQVRRGAVLGAGTILTASTPVYDLVRETIYRRQADRPLEIPPNAVVVPGSRPLGRPGAFAAGLAIYAPIIIKYRDEKTSAATLLEPDVR